MSTTATVFDWSSYITLFVGLFAMMNPFGNAAIFLSMTSADKNTDIKKVARTCTNAVAIILIVTVWVGTYLLELFGISINALTVAGGIIVLLIGLNMLSSNSSASTSSSSSVNIGVVPLAMPLIAGPGAMATVLGHTSLLQTWESKIMVSIVCVAMALVIGIILRFSQKLVDLIGESGLDVVTRVMGLVICGIAIQLLADGLPKLLPGLA